MVWRVWFRRCYGVICIHVDYFLWAGTQNFQETVIFTIKKFEQAKLCINYQILLASIFIRITAVLSLMKINRQPLQKCLKLIHHEKKTKKLWTQGQSSSIKLLSCFSFVHCWNLLQWLLSEEIFTIVVFRDILKSTYF